MTLPNVPHDETMPEATRTWLERLKREIEAALESVGDLDVPTKATEAEATTGTNDTKFLTPLAGVASVKAHSPFLKFAHWQHQENNGTNAGGGASGSDLTRTINTEVYNNITGSSLSSNQFVLPAGTYFIHATAPFHRTRNSRAWLYNVTDAAIVLNGTSGTSDEGASDDTSTTWVSTIEGRFTIAATKTFLIYGRVNRTNNTTGFGRSTSYGGNEVYTNVLVWKLD
jgi:hypothetical protein